MSRTLGRGEMVSALLAAHRRLLRNAPGGFLLLAGVLPFALFLESSGQVDSWVLLAVLPLLYLGGAMGGIACWIGAPHLPAGPRLKRAALFGLTASPPIAGLLIGGAFLLAVAPPLALALWVGITFFALPAGPGAWQPVERGFAASRGLALDADIRLLALLPSMGLIGLPLAVGVAPAGQGPLSDGLWLGWWGFTLAWALYSSACLSAHFGDHRSCMHDHA